MCEFGGEPAGGAESVGGRGRGGFSASTAPGLSTRESAAGRAARGEAREKEARQKTFKTTGTILGALSPVPGGAAIGGALGSLLGGLEPGEGRAGDGRELGGESREVTMFPTREAAAKEVQADEAERRQALRGRGRTRASTILTSPRGVATTAPERKTLLGQ